MKFDENLYAFTVASTLLMVIGISSLPTYIIMWLCNFLFVVWGIELILFLYMFIKEILKGGVTE